MKKLSFSILLLLSFMTISAKQKVENFNTKQQSLFYPNIGQIIDQDRKVRKDVNYHYSAPGFSLSLMDRGMSWTVTKVERFEKKAKDLNTFKSPDLDAKHNHDNDSLIFHTHRMDIEFVNCNPNIQSQTAQTSDYYQNFYTEYTGEKGVTNVHGSKQVTLKNVWNKIDIVFHAKEEGKVEYDIVVHPGGNIKDIQLRYKSDGIIPDMVSSNKIIYKTSVGEVEETIPSSYLAVSKKSVEVGYEKKGDVLGFKASGLGELKEDLVIDPSLVWGTYLGGKDSDQPVDITTDDSSNVFITGGTYSTIGIVSSGAYQTLSPGGFIAFITKFSPTGNRLWSTYYGGTAYGSGGYGNGIVADDTGNVFVTGFTTSSSGIASSGAYQTVLAGGPQDAFLAKFSSTGNRLWGTYYGGSKIDYGDGIALDGFSNVIMVGETYSTSGIATSGVHQTSYGGGTNDAFISKFSSSGNFLWGTYYGGSGMECGYGVITDTSGNIFVTGYTSSTSGITSTGAHQTTYAGGGDAFISKFTSKGTRSWGTYYGGTNGEDGQSIATDISGNVFVTGFTESTSGIASTGAYQTSKNTGTVANRDAYLTKFSNHGNLTWGTYYGGGKDDWGRDITTDQLGRVYLTGSTSSSSGIVTSGAYQTTLVGGSEDVFITIFSSMGTLSLGTYYGGADTDVGYGVAINKSSNIFITGYTLSKSGLSTTGAYQTSNGGKTDAFIAKFSNSTGCVTPTANAGADKSICNGSSTSLGSASVSGHYYKWTSNPVGYTDTTANPTVSPKSTTTYYLKDSVAGGCFDYDTVVITVQSGMGGTYTIGGTSPDFATFTAAVNAVCAKGVCGPVMFNFRDGVYTEQVRMGKVSGVSATNTITFKSESNDSTKVSITYPSSNSFTSLDYIISLDTVNYVTFDKLTFIRTGTNAYGSVVWFNNGASNNTFKNCILKGVKGVANYSYVFIALNANDTNNVIQNNQIKYGYYGIYLNGTSSFTSGGNKIIGNTIDSFYYHGIYIYRNNRPTISKNRIEGYNIYGNDYSVSLFNIKQGGLIEKNIIKSAKTSTTLVLEYCDGTSTLPFRVYNNMISNSGTNGCGILGNSGSYHHYYYNNVLVTNKFSGQAACSLYYSTDTRLLNNNFYNSGSGWAYSVTPGSSSPFAQSDYNNLYTSTMGGGTGSRFCYYGANCSSLSQLRSVTGKESWSVSVDPLYTSTTNLHASASGIKGKATPITLITDDIDGDLRNTTKPDIGADEYVAPCIPPSKPKANDTSFCSSNKAILHATGGNGRYRWYSSPTGGTAIDTTNTYTTPILTKSETFYLSSTNGTCESARDTVVVTVNKPVANAGADKSICSGSSTSIGVSAVTGTTYAWTSNPSGYTSTTANPTVTPTSTTTYFLTSTTTSTGCTNKDTVVITVNAKPVANAGADKSICGGSSTSIGTSSVSGTTYAWTSSPTGYTSTTANPTVSPTTTTTYYLTSTTTSTGCTNKDTVVITVNPKPVANAGADKSICNGSSTSIGASSVSGTTYAWTSNPSGYSSTTANPTVSPTTTTTYYLTSTITSTGCTNKDTVVITVNPLPTANAGADKSICNGSSTSIGSASVSGHYYIWTSNPTGYTNTTANPTVSPTTTTTYYLKDSVAGGCFDYDTVKITVNPKPVANAGADKSICSGSSTSIGASSVTGTTYAWTSNPSGYTSTSANPTVSPTATTTYYLTSTITSTGCTNNDTVVITVNPKPVANAGADKSICSGSSTSIGASSVSGTTYAWTSNPSGYTSTTANPTVSPTATTTYYLTSTITSTGCTNKDTVVITVNPKPIANAGADKSICSGSSTSIGASSVSGTTYAWTSNPSGYTSTTANPTVSPTATTTYYLTSTITSTGCTNKDTVVITVNPKPTANAGADKSICNGSSTSIGASSVSGTTYAWTSNPSGYTSTTANPTVSPTATTTYYLASTTTSTGCTNKDTVVITVNPKPVANAGADKSICSGSSTSIGASAVSGTTYAWTSSPSGYTSTTANPTVSPTSTTTYYLTSTTTSTGCTNKDTVGITVNPLPTANAGAYKSICSGSSTSIGASSVTGTTYAWTSNPSGYTSTTANPTVSPTVTTTYYLTSTTTSTGCTNNDTVVITVNPSPTALAGTDKTICPGSSAPVGAAIVSGLRYVWTSIPSGFSDTTSNPRVSPTTTSTYVLRVTNSFGCIDYDTAKITVLPKVINQNIFNYTNNQDTTICSLDNGNIGFKLFNNYKYDWSNGQKGNIISVSPNTSMYYSVTITDTTTGCSVKDSIKVLVTNCKLVWQGNTDNDWNKKSNWVTVYPLHSKFKSVLDLRIPNSSDSVYIAPKSNMPLINSFTGYGNDLILKKGASLTINTTGSVTSTLQLHGNIISEDSVKINTSIGSIVKMAGISKQFINNNSVLNIHGLDINNPLGVEMNGLINIWEVINPVSGTLTTNDKLTLKSDINATARISAINSGSDIKGKVNVERYIPSGKTNTFFLSSPVKGVVVNDWTDDFSIKANTTVMWVDEIRHTATAMKYFGAGLTDSLSAGKGWKVSIAKRPLTADLKGEINKGNIVLNTTYTPVATNVRRNGINIVGNPYPSPIDWNSSTGWTKTNIENTIYVYNSAIANWGVCSPTGNTNGATSFISSGQSFMVKATGTSPLLAVSELVKSATASTILNKNSNDYELSIKIKDTLGNGDEMKVTFRDDSVTVGYDDGFDADKMDGDFINISSFDDSMNNLSLNFLPKDLFDTHTNNNPYLVDLRTTIDQASDTINFTFGNIMSFDSSIKVFLIDNKLSKEINIWKNTSYKAIVENTDTSRFTLKFFKNMTGVEGNNVQTTNDIKIYPNPSHNGSFSLRGLNESAVNVVISDMNGKELFAQKIASSANSHLINTGLPQGIYVISIHTTSGVIHKKWSVE